MDPHAVAVRGGVDAATGSMHQAGNARVRGWMCAGHTVDRHTGGRPYRYLPTTTLGPGKIHRHGLPTGANFSGLVVVMRSSKMAGGRLRRISQPQCGRRRKGYSRTVHRRKGIGNGMESQVRTLELSFPASVARSRIRATVSPAASNRVGGMAQRNDGSGSRADIFDRPETSAIPTYIAAPLLEPA